MVTPAVAGEDFNDSVMSVTMETGVTGVEIAIPILDVSVGCGYVCINGCGLSTMRKMIYIGLFVRTSFQNLLKRFP